MKAAATIAALATLAFILAAIWVDGIATQASISAAVFGLITIFCASLASNPLRKD